MKNGLTDERLPAAALQVLQAVARLQSFTQAAAALGVSTAAVSQQVRALEARVGVRLLDRTSRRVRATEAGERFLQEVTPALEAIEASLQRLKAEQGMPSGLLRINTSRLAARIYIEPMLGAFMARYPLITLELFLDDTLADIVQGGFDAGIRLGNLVARDMVALPLDHGQRRITVGSPDYLARHGKPRRPADLLDHACLHFRLPGSGRIEPWVLMVRGRTVRLDVTGPLICSDDDWLNRAVLAGHGLAQRFESSIRAQLAEGSLVPVLSRHAHPFEGFRIYYPARRLQAPKLHAFVSFLRETQGFGPLTAGGGAA